MISYQWDVKPQVLELREKLRKAGYRIWIDVEQMHKGIESLRPLMRTYSHFNSMRGACNQLFLENSKTA